MRALLAVPLAGLLAVAGCAPGHQLAEVDLADRSVAVIAAIPPGPRVVSGPWPFLDRPVHGAHGTARQRFEAARAARARLDAAAERVDVAEVIARRALLEAGDALGFRPTGDPQQADFVLDVRLLDYGLYANTFDSPVLFVAEADVVLVERATGEVVWRRRMRERETVRADAFGLEGERRLTARRLTELSTAEMAFGLERLAALAADRVALTLHRAYAASRPD